MTKYVNTCDMLSVVANLTDAHSCSIYLWTSSRRLRSQEDSQTARPALQWNPSIAGEQKFGRYIYRGGLYWGGCLAVNLLYLFLIFDN